MPFNHIALLTSGGDAPGMNATIDFKECPLPVTA
jgi:hypothetical protein